MTAGPIEAAIIVGRLQSMGIAAVVYAEGALPSLGISTGSKVLVHEKHYEAAMLVLQPDDDILWLEDGEDDFDDYEDEDDES